MNNEKENLLLESNVFGKGEYILTPEQVFKMVSNKRVVVVPYVAFGESGRQFVRYIFKYDDNKIEYIQKKFTHKEESPIFLAMRAIEEIFLGESKIEDYKYVGATDDMLMFAIEMRWDRILPEEVEVYWINPEMYQDFHENGFNLINNYIEGDV